MLGDEKELIYNSSVWIQDVVLKTYRKQWMTETNGERKSGKSVLAVHDDNDDDIRVDWTRNKILLYLV